MLTIKQEKFVQELLKGKTQRQAYISAFGAGKMKTGTIDNKACKLFKDHEVKARYNELRKELTKDSMDDVKEIRKMIVEQEKAILNASYGDIVKLDVSVGGDGIIAMPKEKDLGKFDMRAVQEIRYDSRGNAIIKLYDKQGAIDTLREMFGIDKADEKQDDIEIILRNTEGYDE